MEGRSYLLGVKGLIGKERSSHELISNEITFCIETDAASGRYFKRSPNTQLTKHVIHQLVVQSDIECLLWCRRYQNCTSVNYRPGEAPSTRLCEINAAIANEFPGDVVESKEFDYYEALG